MAETGFFDAMAHGYDESFSHTMTGRLQRFIVLRKLMKVIGDNKNLNILELNCGTGEDARFLSSRGHRVFATDASGEMIAIAQKNNKSHEGHSLPVFEVCSFENITGHAGQGPFDMVFSDFGGLNCIGEKAVRQLSDDLAPMIKEGGLLAFVVMGTDCRWEQWYALLHGRFKTVFRRKQKKEVLATCGDQQLKVYYYSPGKLRHLFGEHFTLVSRAPIGLFIPPSGVMAGGNKWKGVMKILFLFERLHTHISCLSNLADHYFLVLQRKGGL